MSTDSDDQFDKNEGCASPVSAAKKRFKRTDSSSLSGSTRRRAQQLNKQFITVQKEDGDIGHIEVNVLDENFSTQQAVLQSLAQMGEIPTPNSPGPGKSGLKEVF